MKREFWVVIVAALIVAAAGTVAAKDAPAPSRRHLIADCMTKQMIASRTISYNEAARLCKEQIKTQSAVLTAGSAAKPSASR